MHGNLLSIALEVRLLLAIVGTRGGNRDGLHGVCGESREGPLDGILRRSQPIPIGIPVAVPVAIGICKLAGAVGCRVLQVVEVRGRSFDCCQRQFKHTQLTIKGVMWAYLALHALPGTA